jgi:hypothetical protein|tara:strand:- start:933 stop:1076 length:144 start_codon:yes stop_codon:yes gene_type:complete
MFQITNGDDKLGEYTNLKAALKAMVEFTTAGGYDQVVVEMISGEAHA